MLDYNDKMTTSGEAAIGAENCLRIATTSPVSDVLYVAQDREQINADPLIPDYMKLVYYWAYLNPRNVRVLDRELVVKLILWFQHRKLQRAAFQELEPGQRVLQPAAVYGDFCPNLARHLGVGAELDIIDIAPIQVLECRAKMSQFPQVRVNRGDAANLGDREYDAICCYFLLHEVPLDYKYAIVQELLNHVRPGGKAIFVDYHKPHWAHPLKPVTSIVFDTLEPFAKELWRHPIESFANADPRFKWRQQNYFGGLFQKVVADCIDNY